MSNTAPSRAEPVVVFPLGRWCPPQETSQPHPPHWYWQEPDITYPVVNHLATDDLVMKEAQASARMLEWHWPNSHSKHHEHSTICLQRVAQEQNGPNCVIFSKFEEIILFVIQHFDLVIHDMIYDTMKKSLNFLNLHQNFSDVQQNTDGVVQHNTGIHWCTVTVRWLQHQQGSFCVWGHIGPHTLYFFISCGHRTSKFHKFPRVWTHDQESAMVHQPTMVVPIIRE